jgi:hypothetical protein
MDKIQIWSDDRGSYFEIQILPGVEGQGPRVHLAEFHSGSNDPNSPAGQNGRRVFHTTFQPSAAAQLARCLQPVLTPRRIIRRACQMARRLLHTEVHPQ